MTTICVDFDGTLVKHRYPDIGPEIPRAFEYLKKFRALGATLILYTMRDDGDKNGPTRTQAVEFCKSRGVVFDHVNENPKQRSWTASPKVYANIYIDDAAVGCPLFVSPGERPWADWETIGPRVLERLAEEPVAKHQEQEAPEPMRSTEVQGESVATGRNDQAEERGPSSLQEALKEIEHWKSIATHLANCHAATAYDVGTLKKTSKAQRERLRWICLSAIELLEGRRSVVVKRETERVVRRCRAVAADLKEAK